MMNQNNNCNNCEIIECYTLSNQSILNHVVFSCCNKFRDLKNHIVDLNEFSIYFNYSYELIQKIFEYYPKLDYTKWDIFYKSCINYLDKFGGLLGNGKKEDLQLN